MMMSEVISQLVTSFIGSLGFALMFGLAKRHLFTASMGGMLSWGVYLAVMGLNGSVFVGNLAASVFAMVYAKLLARLHKCPTTLFIIPSIIPLVPGSSLYYAMSYAVRGDTQSAGYYGHQTLMIVLAIAAGISFTTAVKELTTREH